MENKQIPVKKKTTNDRPSESLFDVEEKPEGSREEALDTTDEDELSFDLPRD